MEWFSVDKRGLAKLIDQRGKAFVVFELLQNCWDTDATRADVCIEPVAGRPYVTLSVEDDDPNGFKNLAHAFTLFAESEKKQNPEKRGRFNLGEKLVLALCEEAEIVSTRGSVRFDAEGRHEGRRKREKGSMFRGTMRMTRDELAEVERAIQTLIPPGHCATTYNGVRLANSRTFLKDFEVSLPTDVADDDGFMRRAVRSTRVSVHMAHADEVPCLYEMGIPVVALTGGERWHVNIAQKIPLNLDRDNVTPAYLQTVRVALANAMRDSLTKADATEVWVAAATEDDRAETETVEKMLDQRFGKKRAVFDPSDPEANKALLNDGYTLISGGSLSKGQWENVRSSDLAKPSGQIKPSGVQYSENGRPENVIDPSKYTVGQARVVAYAKGLGRALLGRDIAVRIVCEITMPHAAWFGDHELTFNLGRLGKAWFDEPIGMAHNELLLHEFAHAKVSDHLTHAFSDEVACLGAKLVHLTLVDEDLSNLLEEFYARKHAAQ